MTRYLWTLEVESSEVQAQQPGPSLAFKEVPGYQETSVG